MNFYDQERIQEIRQNKLIDQSGKCAACGKYFKAGEKQELAHILKQGKYTESIYGKEIIHHEMNMKLTHSGNCNSSVQMNTNKSQLVEAHVAAIIEKIKEDETIQQVMDRR